MTTKKVPAKAVKPATKATKPAAKAKAQAPDKKTLQMAPEPMYNMPIDVRDWIERAQSIMNHQRGEIERMKEEMKELKSYKKWAEHRILRSDHE